MTRLKEEKLALSAGISLAGNAVRYLQDLGQIAFGEFHEEIIESLVKPNKITAVHYYLSFFQDISKEIDELNEFEDNLEIIYHYIYKTLKDIDLLPDFPSTDFKSCDDSYHEYCNCRKKVIKWINYVKKNEDEINDLIVHSALQIVFLDRTFLHDFHLELSDFTEFYIQEIKFRFPKHVTEKQRIKRYNFPKWLTNAVFHRDKGTCTNCGCDLTKLIRLQNTIHIDHIVPLELFGTNDASNFQLLCESCNTSKGARSTLTSSVGIPFWNID
ncbi:HNH endonuclease [Priestia megaterium]|nr:HNH endonuclease [Priestia megaterium]